MQKIRNRVFFQILIPTVVIFLVLVGGGLYFINRSFEDQVTTQKANELNRAARAIDNWLIARISHMIQLSRTPVVREGEREEALSFLRSERERLAFIYSSIFYIRPDGTYWDTQGDTGTFQGGELLAQFTEREKPFYYTGPVLNHPHFARSILIAVPVRSGDSLRAVLATTIPLSTFRRVISYFTLEEFESFALVNPRSVIITDSTAELAGTTEEERFGRSFSSFAYHRDSMVFVSVLRTTWKLMAFIPEAQALAPIRQIDQLVGSFFLAVILLIGSVSLAISATVARPIRRLTDGVHQIMEGNYRQNIQVNTRDEIKELADAFNRLSEQMVKLRTDDQFVFLGHFAARMAHEMRKPLHIAQLAAQNLKAKSGNEPDKHVQMIQQEIGNADRFIGEILNFARPETLNLSRYSLAELLDKTVKKYELVAEEKSVELQTHIDTEIPYFYFDIMKMEQVFSNLLQNAIDAVEQSEPPRSIGIYLERHGEEIRFHMIDSGPGFDDSVVERVMDPYFTTKANGTGLGLAISYRILTAHGATFELGNTPEHHGRVTIRYPLLVGSGDGEGPGGESTHGGHTESGTTGRKPGGRRR
jgi:signal transduction histidine kinase